MKNLKAYVISIFISLSVGALSAFLTRDSMNIYNELTTPPLSPPAILFPIVWTVLFLLMGISAARVYSYRKENPSATREALFVYALSLILNFSWSQVFFNGRMLLLSVVIIVGLLLLILRTISLYKLVSPLASYLQIPYALWVAFATYLNVGILVLNA